MKKLFTLLTLLLCAVSVVWAGDVYKISFNGSNAETKNGEEVTAGTYFSWNSAKHNFNPKFSGCTYDGVEYTSGLKMESATTVSWTSASSATVTIVQSTWSDKTIKLDDTELAVADAEAITGGRVYTITDVEAGSHSVTRGSGESGIFTIIVEYTGAVLTQLDSPEISFNATSGKVTIGAVTNATKVTYTTDGTNPTAESTTYESPFIVEDGTVVKAIAIGDLVSYSHSAVASTTVLLESVTPDVPVISHFNGTVFITCSTPLSTIEYSLDGTSYTKFTRAFTLSENTTVYAKAKRGDIYSEVAYVEVPTISKGNANRTILLDYNSFINNGNTMNGKGETDAEGFALTITGNSEKIWSSGYFNLYIDGNEYETMKLSNGAQNTLTLPSGVKAKRITFYSVINSAEARKSYWQEFNGTNINDNVPMGAWNDVVDRSTNPDVRVFELTGEETSVTFTNTGEQLLFVIAVDVIAEEIPVIIGEKEWATFVPSADIDFTGKDVNAYIVTGHSDATITTKQVYKVAAGTPLLVNASQGNYMIPAFTGAADATTGNLLKVGTGVKVQVEDGKTKYALSVEDGKAAFKKIVSATAIPAGKAYLEFDGDVPAPSLSFDSGETTGISTTNFTNDTNNGEYYNLAGQRVAQPTKGLYIVNGKKYMVK